MLRSRHSKRHEHTGENEPTTISFLSKLNLAEAVMCQTFLTHRRFALHKIRCQEVMK